MCKYVTFTITIFVNFSFSVWSSVGGTWVFIQINLTFGGWIYATFRLNFVGFPGWWWNGFECFFGRSVRCGDAARAFLAPPGHGGRRSPRSWCFCCSCGAAAPSAAATAAAGDPQAMKIEMKLIDSAQQPRLIYSPSDAERTRLQSGCESFVHCLPGCGQRILLATMGRCQAETRWAGLFQKNRRWKDRKTLAFLGGGLPAWSQDPQDRQDCGVDRSISWHTWRHESCSSSSSRWTKLVSSGRGFR